MLVTIFLDFDGVLHPTSANSERLFERAPLLGAITASCQNIEFVVSSSWAAYKDHEQIRRCLQGHPELLRLVVGQTQHLKRPAMDFGGLPERETQCRNWLHENDRDQERWVAIEDEPGCFKTASNVIRTDGKVGLTEANVEALKTKILALQVARDDI